MMKRRHAAGYLGRKKRKAGGRGRARSSRTGRRRAAGTAYVLPEHQSAAAVVSVQNEEQTIGRVLQELRKLPLCDIITVINGTTDGSLAAALDVPGITIVHMPEPLGHDVGRAVGAGMTDADIVLFVDGDLPVPASELMPFLTAVSKGADVALNDIMPYLGRFDRWDDVSVIKAFVNTALGRRSLRANSLTSVPHALSRKALETIGTGRLAVPPAAQAAAILAGLKVTACYSVDVITRNRVRRTNTGRGNDVARLIMGDHMEALSNAMEQEGPRLGLPDLVRRREAAGGDRPWGTG
ncbi:family 2 glycosyl transferase [Paenibacillus sambharensis]|uniref:Family 2 glycosyl transferase n=1 Tax=Paenibacillus sambharensis TaxID=1803190 RepID=A0A2W1LTL8_9BACL|nr:glycosyltransferase [Paenibacillus sambharensis]PZD95131.1 family 2 glycosyl transferase [Paenibacillus sambharensis]